jgi:SAM-dependent methyltransferase
MGACPGPRGRGVTAGGPYGPDVREQRLVFGEDAELYDKARAGYPESLVDGVLSFVGLEPSQVRALEVGAGTGKATMSFARRGVDIVALEPSAAMAALAVGNCRQFPNVRVEQISFEDWPLEAATFSLVFAAQSWHWVDSEIRCAKAADALVRGGTLALFWHRTDWHGEPVRDDLEELYRRLVPELHARAPGFPGLRPAGSDDDHSAEIAAASRFTDLVTRTYPWSATLTADAFVELLHTQSDHRLLPEDTRAQLLGAVGDLINDHGGRVMVPHATLLILTHVR